MAKNSGEIGATGLAQFSGIIQSDFLRELRGIEGYRRFREMTLNSPIVGGLLLAYRHPILSMEWTFSSTDGDNDPRLEILNAAWENMRHSWADHVSEAMGFLWAGYYPFEIVYGRGENGWVLWDKFSPRGQDTITRWKFADNGEIEGYYQRVNWTEEKFIPIDRTILYRINVERNNPEGRSILRTSWIPYYYAKHLMSAEAIGIERGMDGFPTITLPEGASTDDNDPNSDAAKAAEFVRNIRNDEQAGMVLPFGWTLELIAPGAQSRLDADKVIRRYESRMLMSTHTEFLNLGQESTGSYSLATDKTDFFIMSVNAIADVISDTVTQYAVPRLMKLNGYDAEGLKLEHSPANQEDVTKITSFLAQVSSLITWTAEDEVWFRQIARMPERKVEDIQKELDEKQAQKEAMREMFMDKGGDKDKEKEKEKDKPNPFAIKRLEAIAAVREVLGNDATIDLLRQIEADNFAASAPDKADRERMERKYKKALTAAMERTRAKVLKAAKEYRQ